MHSPHAPIPASVLDTIVDQRSRFAVAYSILHEAIASHSFPGAVFGVLFEGSILALDGLGRFTYDPESPSVGPATTYDLASVSKVLATTSMAMLLYDRGKLDLDSPLGDILPGFVVGVESPRLRAQVTLRHLLAHTSGLPAYARLFEQYSTPTALFTACLQMPLELPPATRAEYSDIGFILLGKALEVVAGEPLDVFCHREIFAPLGMASTRYRPPTSWRASIPPTVDDTAFRHRVIQGEVHDENCSVLGGVSGHAGLFSNALDVLTFAACILANGTASNGLQMFQPSTVELFSIRQTPPEDNSRALGWDTPSGESSSGHHFNRRSIGHLGYAGTSLWIDLERKLAVVLLTNRTWPDRSNQAIRTVRPAFHDAVIQALAIKPRP